MRPRNGALIIMNIIRTAAVELTSIPAIAYKQKLGAGGSGLRIIRLDQEATGIFTVDRRTGGAVGYGAHDAALFPEHAVDEALELTEGLPYSSRGKIKVAIFEQKADKDDVTEDQADSVDMVDSDEYRAIVERYSDENGRMNYALMNKDFIQFAAKSKHVADLVSKKATDGEIVTHILRNRATFLTNKKESLSDAQTEALLESLEEIDPRSAFKELKNHIRRMLSR